MHFEQIITPGQGCFSYLLGCPMAGEAVVVDPRRDIDIYRSKAKELELPITHIFETHVHADHISGAAALAQATGAAIYFHEKSKVAYEFTKVRHGDSFKLGNLGLTVLHTPGHTPESVSLLIFDYARSNSPEMILTGDLLFVGDVGRPDLPGELIVDEQIHNLYESLHSVLGELPDFLEIYPAHGQGSLCGSAMSAKPFSTLGYERLANHRLAIKNFDKFKSSLVMLLPPRPQSFSHIIASNLKGAQPLTALLNKDFAAAMTPKEVAGSQVKGAMILDLRSSACFASAHIPGSINIEATPGGPMLNWAGMVIRPTAELILVLNNDSDFFQMKTELGRIGYDQVIGYLSGGLRKWMNQGLDISRFELLSPASLKKRLREKTSSVLLDVRSKHEVEQFKLEGAVHMPFEELLAKKFLLEDLKGHEIIVICQSGYRAAIAASLIQAANKYLKIAILAGGLNAWRHV